MADKHQGKYIEAKTAFTEEEGPAELATYIWLPAGGAEAARGVVFLLHGVHVHARFEFLDEDEENRRTRYAGSLVAGLNGLGLAVVAHDHVGHGRSARLSAYFARFGDLVDGSLAVVEAALARPELAPAARRRRFLVGTSMGGAVAILVARRRPEFFHGVVLCSPAVQTPDSMFGLWGRFLHSISGLLSRWTPKLRVLSLPPSPFEDIKQAYEDDEMVCTKPMRCRVGAEFLVTYKEIGEHWHEVKFPLVVFSGGKDELVSPAGITDFVSKIPSTDKSNTVFEDMGHEVLREPGREQVRAALLQWIKDRM